jgi:hypothetical protein
MGMTASAGAIVDVNDFSTYSPAGGETDVVIETSKSNNFNGVALDSGSSLNLQSAKLRILNPGQSWGGNTGGVLVSNGSSLTANANLIVMNSLGQGVFVTNDSHASLDGSQITGSQHGGLVAANLSTIGIGSSSPPTVIGANATDLFCDSKSVISGATNISNVNTISCGNLLPGDNETIP